MTLNSPGNIFVACVAACLFLVAAWGTFHAVRQLLFWPKTMATIARYWITHGSEGGPYFHPVLRFVTVEGRPVTAISSWGSWRRPWSVGTRLVVRYHPANPRWAEVNCFANLWGFPLTFAVLATGWLLFWCLGPL